MSATQIVIIIGYVVAIVLGLRFLAQKKKEKPGNEYDVLMSILDIVIQRELKVKYEDYKLRDVRVIYNFKEDLTEIVVTIRSGLSETFMNELMYYHPKDYINRYIVKNVEKFLIEYTQNNKIKTM